MGLKTTFKCYSGSYSGFDTFRKELAKRIGINLDDMEGFDGKISFDTVDHDITPLLNHSDCDGELSVSEATRVANGLSQILSEWPEDQDDWIREKAVTFQKGCLKAIKANKPILFQ